MFFTGLMITKNLSHVNQKPPQIHLDGQVKTTLFGLISQLIFLIIGGYRILHF